MLKAKGLAYRAGGNFLVSGIDLSIEAGEVVAVLGPNGAGESTLLKLLCGQFRPTTGMVSFGGKSLGKWPARELARCRSVLLQQSMAPFEFSALEIVLLGRLPHGDAARCTHMALEAMKWTECQHLARRTVNTLSGGELQRVHLARVLVQIGLRATGTIRCLMLDEPVSSLDPAHQHAALCTARQIASQGAAVLIILHDLNLAGQYADRVVLLKAGRIAAAGTPAEVLRADLIGDVFGVRARVVENPVCGAPAVFLESAGSARNNP